MRPSFFVKFMMMETAVWTRSSSESRLPGGRQMPIGIIEVLARDLFKIFYRNSSDSFQPALSCLPEPDKSIRISKIKNPRSKMENC